MFVVQESKNQIDMKGNERGLWNYSMLPLKSEIIYL